MFYGCGRYPKCDFTTNFGIGPSGEDGEQATRLGLFGQMSSDEKHALSHRGKAARAMAAYLEEEGW